MNSSSSSSESLLYKLFILCGLEEGNVWSSVVAVTDRSENKIQNVNLINYACREPEQKTKSLSKCKSYIYLQISNLLF